MGLLEEFMEAFRPMPDRALHYLLPYLQRMVNEEEMQLIVTLKKSGGNPKTTDEVADLMRMSRDDASDLLKKCVNRSLLNKKTIEGRTSYEATTFYGFLMAFASNDEEWDRSPLYVRKVFSEWSRRDYLNRISARTEKMKRGEPVVRLHDEDVLLLEEVLERVEAANDFAVVQCGCRSLESTCKFPTETCLRFNEDARRIVEKGQGRRLTRDEMRELVLKIDRMGLIHQGIKNWRETDMWSVCNCCACCCMPLRAGIEIGVKGMWPKTYYIATFDAEKCNYCGTCVRRCHYGAWELGDTEVEVGRVKRRNVLYSPDKCLGCGLCANTCPTKAIVMRKLELTAETARARIFPEHDGKIFYDEGYPRALRTE